MAATDIQYGGLDPVLYTPDFTFLKYVLDKKTGQYEQGLKSASASYNSIKKEVSDPVNAQRRDQYIKDAQDQLQKIASSDLSLQQNVNYANSIFDPIATNKAFAFDAYHTARIKKELSKEDAWMNAENPEERKKYNGEIKEWVNRDLESLKTGQGDVANYKVQGRSAQAFVDAQDILLKSAKDQGFKMKVDELGQPYIVTVEGGPKYAPQYEAFANNILANDAVYQKQTGILGQNRAEKVLEKYRTDPEYAPKWANASVDDIYKDYALTNFDKHKVEQKNYIEALNKNLTTETADINAALNGPDSAKYIKGASDVAAGNNATPEASMYLAIKEKADNRNNLNGKLKDIQTDYDNSYGTTGAQTDKIKENYLKNFTGNPAGYFSDLQFKNDVSRFVNIKSSFFTRKITEDKAYVDVTVAKTNAMATINKIQDTQLDNVRADEKLALEERKEDFKETLKGGTKRVKNADGTYTTVEPDIKLTDISATQITKTQVLNDLKSRVTTSSNAALDNITNNYGSFYMLQAMGMEQPKVGTLRGMFTRYFQADDKTKFKATAEENKILNEAYSTMWAFAKDKNPSNTFLEQERANYGKGTVTIDKLPDLLDRAMTNFKARNDQERDAKVAMVEYKNNCEKITATNAALEAGKKVVIDQLKNEMPSVMFTADRKDIVGVPDIVKQLKIANIELETGAFSYNKKAVLSDDDLNVIARKYVNGNLNVTKKDGYIQGKSDIYIDGELTFSHEGKDYKIVVPQSGSTGFPLSSADFQKNLTKINENVSIPAFEKAVGSVSASPIFKLSGDTRQTVIDDMSKSTQTNTDMYAYSDGTFEKSTIDPDLQKEIRNAMLKKENLLDVSLYTASPLANGGQAVAITFAKEKGDKSNPEPGWSGKTIYFPITVTPNSPKVFHIFNELNEVSEFEPKRAKGETYTVDTFKADGAYAEIMPKQPGARDGVVKLWYKPYNAVTKTYATDYVAWEKDMQYNLDKTTFAEIKQTIYKDFLYPYVNDSINYEKQLNANTIAAGGTPITASSLYNSLIH